MAITSDMDVLSLKNTKTGEVKDFNIVDDEARDLISELETNTDSKLAEKADQSSLNLLQKQVNNIVGHNNNTNGNTELIDIRTGADGTVYDTAGEAVRGQVNNVLLEYSRANKGSILLENLIENEYVKYGNGSFVSTKDYSRTSFIDCSNLDFLTILTSEYSPYNGFYDSEKEFISSFSVGSMPNNSNKLIKTTFVPVPEKAKWFVLSGTSVSIKNIVILNKLWSKVLISLGLCDINLIEDSYITLNGSVAKYSGWSCIEPIAVQNKLVILSTSSSKYNAFYDQNRKYISSFSVSPGFNIIEIPDGGCLVSCSNTSNDMSKIKIYSGIQSEFLVQILSLQEEDSSQKEKIENLEKEVLNLNENYLLDNDAFFYRNLVPEYYLSQIESPESFDDSTPYLDRVINEVPSGKHFLFFCDVHWERNRRNTISLLEYVRKRLKINKVIFGGDIIDKQPTKYKANKLISDFAGQCRSAFGSNFLTAIGDHDTNLSGGTYTDSEKSSLYYPPSQFEKIVLQDLNNNVIFQNESERLKDYVADNSQKSELESYFKQNYYVDDSKNQIRFIVLNSGTVGYGYQYDLFGLTHQLEMWLSIDFINEALSSIPEDYDIILAAHKFAGVAGNDSPVVFNIQKSCQAIASMLIARKKRNSVSVSITSNVSDTAKKWFGGDAKTFDYSNKTSIGKIGIVTGHDHYDDIITWTDGNGYTPLKWNGSEDIVQSSEVVIPIILTTCDAYKAWTDAYDCTPKTEMKSDTITEQAFDCITLNDEGITCTRFGAGVSRFIPIS